MSLNFLIESQSTEWGELIFFFSVFFPQRYREAAQSFGEVLKLDGSYAEAAQELMRVQITQLMVCYMLV